MASAVTHVAISRCTSDYPGLLGFSSQKRVCACRKMKCAVTEDQFSGRSGTSFSGVSLHVATHETLPLHCQRFGVDAETVVENGAQESGSHVANEGLIGVPRLKRPFCGVCRKPASLCICGRIQCVVKNEVGVTILQHPDEKDHALGSARIAILSLAKVQLITVPEVDEHVSYRIRPKVPNSKRSIKGRGGKKLQTQGKQDPQRKRPGQSRVSAFLLPKTPVLEVPVGSSDEEFQDSGINGFAGQRPTAIPPWIDLPEGTGLLYPSDSAVELTPSSFQASPRQEQAGVSSPRAINHLIVLDGTWAKARRMYCENSWLQTLPHFRLSTTAPSLSQDVRRQPKPGCLSTVESIVFALGVLEPETQGLETLLEVFNSMIDDQKRCKEQRSDSRKDTVR